MAIIELKNLTKFYGIKHSKVEIFKDVNFKINKGDNIALVGPSGSGKTTLLQILGLLDVPCSGSILFNDKKVTTEKERVKFRRESIGFIYQFHHLMPEFTAIENVIMPLMINKKSKKESLLEAEEILISLGLKNRMNNRPHSLSGGERQRVSIARGLVHKPEILLADEPTGNLDPSNADNIFNIFLSELKKRNQTSIIVTHSQDIAKKCAKIITISNKNLK